MASVDPPAGAITDMDLLKTLCLLGATVWKVHPDSNTMYKAELINYEEPSWNYLILGTLVHYEESFAYSKEWNQRIYMRDHLGHRGQWLFNHQSEAQAYLELKQKEHILRDRSPDEQAAGLDPLGRASRTGRSGSLRFRQPVHLERLGPSLFDQTSKNS